MTIHATYDELEVEAHCRMTAETVHTLASKTARLFAQGKRVGANATLEKMLDIYTSKIPAPLSRAWTSLPSLSDVKTRMVIEFACQDGVSDQQARSFGDAMDLHIRGTLERQIPALRELGVNPSVQLSTMQSCVGNIMLERDKSREELALSSSGILGKIRSRFLAKHGGDWNTEYMNSLSAETFSHAVAHTAAGVVRDVDAGISHPDTRVEIGFLADVVEKHASASQRKTLSLLSDIREKAAELDRSHDRMMAFSL
jgi:hypothetical protein